VLEPESSRLPAAKPNVGEPPLLSGETATTKTGEQPSAVDATPGATPPTAAAKAGPDAFGVRLAEAPPTPTDKTELQVSAETPVSPSKVERPARNLAMVPSAPGTTDELEASEVTIDDAPPSEPSLVHGVRPGAAAVADVSSAEASQADGAEIEAPSNRISEIPPEVDPEDLEISDAPFVPGQFPLRPLSLPGFARPDLAAAVEAERAAEDPTVRRARYWWDEMFGDDFLRTMDRLTDQQIRKEVNFIEDSLGVQQGAIILDLACGSGRHAVELAARGYNVVGYDLSVAMLARAADEAHDRNQKLNFLQGDMRDMGFEEMFDAVYCWATSFGYFDDEKNQLVAQRIHRALRKDGMLLLDVANRDFVAKVQPSLVWFEGDGCVCMDDMRVDFISSRLKVKRMIMMDDGRTRELDYSIRLYTLHELGNMLHDVGFKVIEVSGHTSTPRVFMGADSSRLLVLAEKA
jgi:SAM-dependent methyltransferase